MSDVEYKILEAIIVAVLGWLAGRFSIKTKQEVKNDDHEQRLQKMEAAVPLLLKCANVQLLALNGKVNGECEQALDELEKYFYNK